MPSIEFSQEDFEFLKEQSDKDGVSIEEYVSMMVDRQRVIVKYPPKATSDDQQPKSNLEPPHRKWGM
ncbi:MAG: hypothetical protein WCG75_01360 [Armatimonadota bacterium]